MNRNPIKLAGTMGMQAANSSTKLQDRNDLSRYNLSLYSLKDEYDTA